MTSGNVDGIDTPSREMYKRVSIHRRIGLIKRDAKDRCSDIIPHPGQLSEGLPPIGNPAVCLFNQLPGRLVQVSGPGIIPQSFPGFEHLVQISPGQALQCGKPVHKGQKIGHCCFDLCLLEHHL